jgi:hypothetical protein
MPRVGQSADAQACYQVDNFIFSPLYQEVLLEQKVRTRGWLHGRQASLHELMVLLLCSGEQGPRGGEQGPREGGQGAGGEERQAGAGAGAPASQEGRPDHQGQPVSSAATTSSKRFDEASLPLVRVLVR